VAHPDCLSRAGRLGFSHADRNTNVRRIEPVSEVLARNGERDVKGLYAGQAAGLTGVDDPYEPPVERGLV
jgi:adenylylsulfate kinase